MSFWLGCAVWAYRGWLGDFYPQGSPATQMLKLYTERLTCVEGNTTFYGLPTASTVQKWADTMPEGFKFCPKLSKSVTHEGDLMNRTKSASLFIERMHPLRKNLGPVLMQLSPNYSPRSWPDLKKFLTWWPHDKVPLCLEVRHLGWWQDAPKRALHELLEELGSSRVLLDTRPIYECPDNPQRDSMRKKPDVPLEVFDHLNRAPHVMVRYIGHPVEERNKAYLKAWAGEVASWMKKGVDVYFFTHCPMEERSPRYAKMLFQELKSHDVDAGPLPWDSVKAPPKQLGLF